MLQLTNYNHPYYCSTTNYYVSPVDLPMVYDTAQDFLDEFRDADVDYNLIFRWDIEERIDEHTEVPIPNEWRMFIYMMQQRKGKFVPIVIQEINEEDLPEMTELLEAHWDRLTQLWHPLA